MIFREFSDIAFQYFGGQVPLGMAAFVILLLIVLRRKIPCSGALILFTAGIFAAVLNPVSRLLWTKIIQPHLYWRAFWLLPVPLLAGLAAAALAGEGKLWRRILTTLLCICALILTGKNVYNNSNFSVTDNPFKLPSEAVAAAHAILPEEGGTKVLVPDDLFCYIRQYSSAIRMPYGRNIAGFTSVVTNPRLIKLHDRMNRSVYPTGKICKWAAKYECEYIIFLADRPMKSQPEEYGYVKQTELGNYLIYRRTEA